MEVIQEVSYNGGNIQIVRDPEPTSPKECGDDSVFLVAFHRSFSVKDHGIKNAEDIDVWRETHNILPLFAYIHGGVALSLGAFGCRWDSGQVGYVLVSKDMNDPESAAKTLVEEWQRYLDGEVYGYRSSFEDDVDSCYGFHSIDDALEEGKRVIDYENKQLSLF